LRCNISLIFSNRFIKYVVTCSFNSKSYCMIYINKVLFALLLVVVANCCTAQLNGIYTIPGSYPNIVSAVTALNAVGVSGNVVFNVSTGTSENAPVGGIILQYAGGVALANQSNAAQTVIFQRNGAGANPIINAYTGTQNSASITFLDGIVKIVGVDYVTFDGIDLSEIASNVNATAWMEMGYGLLRASNTNGTQNCTIKNCAVNLNNGHILPWAAGIPFVGSIGIFSAPLNNISTTLLNTTSASVAGANSNNVLHSNTIKNVASGIVLQGIADATSPYTYYDQANTIGSNFLGGNVIENYVNYGISCLYQNNVFISSNSINNIASGGPSPVASVYGIYNSIAKNSSPSINNNTISLTAGTTTNSAICDAIVDETTGAGAVTIDYNTITLNGGSLVSPITFHGINRNPNGGGLNLSALNVGNNNFKNIDVRFGYSNPYGVLFLFLNNNNDVSTLYFHDNYTSGAAPPYVKVASSGLLVSAYAYVNTSVVNVTGTVNIINNNFSEFDLSGNFNTLYLFNESGGISSVTSNFAKNISNNIIKNISGGGAGTIIGFYVSKSNAFCSVNNNVVENVSGANIINPYIASAFVNADIHHNIARNINALNSFNGIRFIGSKGLIHHNSFYNMHTANSNAAGVSCGILAENTLAGVTLDIYNNEVYDLSVNGPAFTQSLYGIYGNAVTGGTTTYSIYNNLVAEMSLINSAVGNLPLTGIKIGSGVFKVYHNTVALGYGTALSSVATNFGAAGLYYELTGNTTVIQTTSLDLRNNILYLNGTPNGTGVLSALQRANGITGIAPSNFLLASNYNIYYAPNIVNSYLYSEFTTAAAVRNMFNLTNDVGFNSTCSKYKAFMSTANEDSTFTELPAFNGTGIPSVKYSLVNGTLCYAESGGQNLAAVPTDFNAVTRPNNLITNRPDVGFTEFTGIKKPFSAAVPMILTPGAALALNCVTPTGSISVASNIAGTVFSWIGPGAVSPNNSSSGVVSTAGTYSVTGLDPVYGCTVTATVNVTSTAIGCGCLVQDKTFDAGVNVVWQPSWSGSGWPSDTTEISVGAGYGSFVGDNNAVAEIDAQAWLQQSVTGLTIGSPYTLTFLAGRRTAGGASIPNPITINVKIDGGALTSTATRTNTVYNLTTQSYNFVATQTTHVLSLRPIATYTSTFGMVIDDIDICAVISASVIAGPSLTLTCLASSGTITATATPTTCTYSWAGPGIVSGSTTSAPTVNTAGIYTVTVTDPANGGTATTTVAVTTNSTFPTAIIVADTTVCSHDLVTLSTPSIGTYLWTGPGFGAGFSSTLQNPTNPFHFGTSLQNGGWYYLTVTNAAGCKTKDSLYISILTPPDPFYLNSIVNCQETFTVGVFSSNGPIISYSWGPIALGTGSVVTVPFGYSGAINCLLVDSEGCGQGIIWSTTPLVPPSLALSSGTAITCSVPNAIITASSTAVGATFNWTGSGIIGGGTTPSATVNTAGVYTVVVTDPATGCATNSTVSVTSNSTLPVITSATSSGSITCTVLTSTLIGTSAGNTLTWNGGALVNATNPSTVNASGNYTLTSTNAANGCVTTSVVSVTSNTTLPVITSVTSSGSITCSVLTSTLTGTSAGNTLVWNGGALVNATNPATVNAGGAYTVTATNTITGCSNTSTVLVSSSSIVPTPIIYTPNSWYCVGDNTTPLNSSSGNLWYSNAALTNLVGTGPNFSPPTITGISTYYVVDTLGACASAAASVTVQFTNCAAPACATNLLSNGGFETYSACPTNATQLTNAINWLGSGSYYNTICNGYYNSPSYFPFFTATNYTMGLAGGGVFPPPVGAGSAGLILGGTMFKNFVVQQVDLGCSKQYTLQFRATAPRSDNPPDNSLCVYGSNTPPPYSGCSASLTLLACLPSPASINNYWTPQTITFTPTVNYSYMVLTGQCPTSTGHGGTVFLDDLFLCGTCVNPPVVTTAEIAPASCIGANGAVTSTVVGCSGTYAYDWQNVALLGTTVSTLSTASNLIAGTYSLTVTDGGGCSKTSSVTITSNIITPTVTATSSGSITCSVLTSTLTGTSAGNTIVWNGGALVNATNPATVNIAGTYTVTSTNTVTGCSASTTVAVVASGGLPSVSVVAPLQITCSVPTITLTGSSVTPSVTYQWTGGAAAATQTVNTAGNYTLTVTNTVTGCASTTVVTVTSNTTAPVITSATNSGSITCTVLTSTLAGTSAGNTMLWNGGALVNAANPAIVNVAGNYTVNATNASNGCTTTTVVSVTSNTTVPVIASAINSGSITCTNATSTLTGTSAGNTMLWNGGVLVNATNPATVNAAGNYTVTATNAVTGCASTTIVAVTTNTTLPVITSATSSGSITCTALTSTLSGTSAGNTLTWNGGALVNATNPAIVNSSGTYSVTATNTVTGCSVTTTVGVLASGGLPSVSVVAPLQITCSVPTITLTGSSATPSVTYQWTGGAAAATQTVNAAGNYTLTVTNTVTGCASTTVVAVTSNTTAPVITSATNSGSITCTALTSTLSGTSAGNVLTWNGGALVNATNPAIVNAAGNYTLTVSNAANGCTTTTVVSVTTNTTLPVITSASSSGAINCGSGSSTLTAISAGNVLTWNGGALVNATNPSTVSTAGNYTVTSTTAVNGCSTSTVITVIATSPNVTAGAALVLNCSVLNGTINVTSITPGVTYAWSPAVVSGGTTNIATVNTAGTYSCVVTETATACTNTGVVTVTSNTTAPVITSAVSNSVMICGLVNNTTTLTAISAGNALVWNGGVLVNAPNPSIVSSAGIYTVTATNASNGCLSTATVAAISNTLAPIITTVVSSGSITCINNSATLTATSAGNTLVWSGTGIVSPLNPAVVNAAGTYTVMAINPSNGCTVTTTMAVTTNTTLPVITSSSATGTITCTSLLSTLTGISIGNTLTWNGGALANATNPSTVNASGTYTLTSTNVANGCVTNTTVSVNSNITLPTLTAGSPPTISCITNTAQVTGSSLTAGVTYSWSGAGITAGATTSSATVNAAGVYSLTVTSSSTGCSNTTTVLVSASPSPTASVSSDVTIFSGASTTLTAGGGGTYVWNNGPTTSSQVVSPKETTNYCVTVTDGAGCTNQKCVLVTVELSCYTNDEYETPTAFTPNNDGMNDQFSLQGWDECTTSFFITVYDRWGEKIFESEDVNFNWDGTYKGKALGSAVFVYYIKADILKVGAINKKGNITLIR